MYGRSGLRLSYVIGKAYKLKFLIFESFVAFNKWCFFTCAHTVQTLSFCLHTETKETYLW